MARLTTYLDIESCKILRSGFDFTSNLTSAIGDLANRGFLASYVSRHTAMAYDKPKQNDLFPSKIYLKKNFFVHTARSTVGSHNAVSNLSYINLTTKHPKMSKRMLPRSKLASSTLPQTSIA